ncbi:MAG: ABC transporter permease, partial [Prevotellaceae bacterium]|nr:ABC transporter permease [Prevotellaceae bacterium]
MLKNFLFVLNRFKTASVINILGLSVALLVFFVVLMQVWYDFTYDRGYANADRIVRLHIYMYDGTTDNSTTSINFQIPARIHDRLPEVEAYCMMTHWGNESFDIDKGSAMPERYDNIPVARTTQGFLRVFTPEITAGDTSALFAAPGKAMISEKTARRLFGGNDPIGQTIRYHYGNGALTVQAVYRDFPDNSSMPNGLYTYLQEYDEEEWSFRACFLLRPGTLATAREKLIAKEMIGEEIAQYLDEHPEVEYRLLFSSLNDLYLDGPEGNRINTALSLLAIGLLTLVIAFVNFVNLSLAMAPSRVKNITIRKLMGANKTTLRLTVASESLLFTLIAAGMAFVGIRFLQGSAFAQELFPTIEFSLWSHARLFAVATGAILLLAFVIGL